MHGVVRSFRATFVEGRFVPLAGTLIFIASRLVLFYTIKSLPGAIPGANYAWDPVARWVADPWVSFLASTVSIFLVALISSRLNARYNLIRSRSTLPFVIPLFLFSCHPYFLVMTGDWIAMLFVLLAFFPLLESYQKPDSYLYSFRAAILIAIASLFQIYALVLLPLWWGGEQAMRGGQSRAFVSSLFGLFLVYISVFSVYLLRGDIQGFMQPLFSYTSLSIPALPAYTIAGWGGVLAVGLFFVINMILAAKIYSRDKVLTLTFTRFAVFLIITLLLLQVAYWAETLFFLLLALSLIAYLNAYLFTRTRAKGHIYLAYGWAVLTLLFYLTAFYPFSDFLL